MSKNQESVTWDAENNRYIVILDGHELIAGKYFVSDEGRFTTERGYNANPAVRSNLMLEIQIAFESQPEHQARVERIFSALQTQALAETAMRSNAPA